MLCNALLAHVLLTVIFNGFLHSLMVNSWKCIPVSASGSKRLRHYPWQHAESLSFDSLFVDESH